MKNRVGVLMVGLGGGIATTVVAGAMLMRRGLAPRLGMLTETGRVDIAGSPVLVQELLGLTALDDLVFGGWDIRTGSLFESSLLAGVVHQDLLLKIRDELEGVQPLAGLYSPDYVRNLTASHVQKTSSLYDAAERLRAEIRSFREKHGTERLVLVNVASTERAIAPGAPGSQSHHEKTAPPSQPLLVSNHTLSDPDAFVAGLKSSDPVISPSMVYFYAAIMEGVPHVNFTPNFAEVPALCRLAIDKRVLHCGRDGKTGQTFLKTVLAPAFRARQLRVEGWFSTNILGNSDGRVLSDPASLSAKLGTKATGLEEILGYKVGAEHDAPCHQVTIHYHPPRGDEKEAWDSIDLAGFLNARVQLKINFLCRDSILAAPLVLDLVRFVRHAADKGSRAGVFRPMSCYFKMPLHSDGEEPVHAFFAQQRLLTEYILEDHPNGDPTSDVW